MSIPIMFQGCDGWGEGLRMLDPDLHAQAWGVETSPWATRTARAAGHRTIRADVETFPLDHLAPAAGLIASPPCQAFSAAGKGAGRALVADLAESASDGCLRPDLPVGIRLVLEPVRWITALRPRWVALEQVPSILPVWQGYEAWLRSLGYSTWAGVLLAANYGVPQTRKRAMLVASLDRAVSAPHRTHAKAATLLEQPWVTMADALGWTGELDRRQQTNGVPARAVPVDEPAPTLTGVAGSKSQWVRRNPAPTVTSGGTGSGGGVEVFGNAEARRKIAASWPYERPAHHRRWVVLARGSPRQGPALPDRGPPHHHPLHHHPRRGHLPR